VLVKTLPIDERTHKFKESSQIQGKFQGGASFKSKKEK